MCEPTAIVVGGSILVGGIMKGQAEKDAAKASASAMKRNARIAEMAASDALQRGEQEAGRVQMAGEAVEGQQRAGYGAMGVDVNSGSAARTQADTAALTAMDMETVRNNAQREAWGLEVQATNMLSDASAVSKAGANALLGGIIGGLAGGASGAMSQLSSTGYFSPKPTAPGKA
jgi:hypothetical protein